MMRRNGELWLGLDLGISTVKAALFDSRGTLVAAASDEYLIMPDGDIVEVDPEVYWAPMVRVILQALAKWGGNPSQIRALAVSSHTETVIPLDAGGAPVRPAIVWMDNRSRPQAAELEREMGAAHVFQISGQPEINPIWPLTKIRWMAQNEPDLLRKTAKFLLPEDYILFRLSGKMVAEQTVWSSSLLLDIRRKTWVPKMLSFAGVSSVQLPELCAPGTFIGNVTEAAARETGLSQDTWVVAGAIDQVCAAVAAANIVPGVVSESTGSVLALLATTAEPVLQENSRIPCHIHALPDTYCLLPWNPTGGIVLKWFRDMLAGTNSDAARGEVGYERLSSEAELVPPGCDGLVMLPHLAGALFPEYNQIARGVFYGITLTHTRGHFVRSIMEAIAFLIRRDLEGLSLMGAGANEIRVLGGGARSRIWSQIKANACHIPVIIPAQEESAALGAAILAAVGCGFYPDIPSAVQAMTAVRETIAPDPAQQAVYDSTYALYQKLYESVKDLYADCDHIKQLARQ
ncbi:MAG: FGGY family carbohydrate kinase [Terriglobales bacterium]|jgi:xylulokinase